MAPEIATRLTYEDYLDLPEDGKQYELIEGELTLNPAPVPRHQWIVLNIAGELRTYHLYNRAGTVFSAPVDVVLADDVVVQPDVVVICHDRMSILAETNIQGAPSIVVEVLSDRTRRKDEIIKRKLYERYGVGEYWIVDPAIETVKIYRREGAAFTRVAEISTETGGAITSPLLPRFALDVNVVFGTPTQS